MLSREIPISTPYSDFSAHLPRERRWRYVALVVAGLPSTSTLAAARELVRRDDAQLLLYDADAAAGFTSPYPSAAGDWLPPLLDEAALQRVGKGKLAAIAHDLAAEGLLAGVYLAPRTDLADLEPLVVRESIDLVISPLPTDDRRQRHIHEVRRHAHLLSVPDDVLPTLHPPLGQGETLPIPGGIRWPYLLVVLITFLLARGRNRA